MYLCEKSASSSEIGHKYSWMLQMVNSSETSKKKTAIAINADIEKRWKYLFACKSRRWSSRTQASERFKWRDPLKVTVSDAVENAGQQLQAKKSYHRAGRAVRESELVAHRTLFPAIKFRGPMLALTLFTPMRQNNKKRFNFNCKQLLFSAVSKRDFRTIASSCRFFQLYTLTKYVGSNFRILRCSKITLRFVELPKEQHVC